MDALASIGIRFCVVGAILAGLVVGGGFCRSASAEAASDLAGSSMPIAQQKNRNANVPEREQIQAKHTGLSLA